jgi:hypothetical protein
VALVSVELRTITAPAATVRAGEWPVNVPLTKVRVAPSGTRTVWPVTLLPPRSKTTEAGWLAAGFGVRLATAAT